MQKMWNWMGRKADKPRYVIALMIVLMLMAAALLSGHIIYQTNDDSTIISMAAGCLTGTNEASNGLTGYLYGALLAGLYAAAPAIPWHAVLLLAFQCLALICVLKSMLKSCDERGIGRWVGMGVFAALTLAVYAAYFFQLQFTAAAALAATGAYSLILCARGSDSRRARVLEWILALALSAFGFLLRADALLLTLPVLLIPAVCMALQCRETRAGLLKRCGALLLLVGVLSVSDAALYRAVNPDWETYQAFEEQTTRLLDFSTDPQALAAAGEASGWPPELSRMVSGWFFLDARVNTAAMQAISATLDQAKAHVSLLSVVRSTGSIIKSYPLYQLCFVTFALGCVLLLVNAIRKRQPWLTLVPVGLAAYAVLTIAYFYGVLARFPERVAFACVCPVYTVAALQLLQRSPAKPRKWLCVTCAALLAACSVYGVFTLDVPHTETSGAALTQRVNEYASASSELLYVGNIAQEYDPLEATAAGECRNVIFWGHGLTGSPVLVRQQQLNGYTGGFDSADFFDENVRVLVTDDAMLASLMALLQVDAPGATSVLTDTGEGFSVYQVVR